MNVSRRKSEKRMKRCYGAWTVFASRTSFKNNQNKTTHRTTNELIASSSSQDMDTNRTFTSQVRTAAYTTFTKRLFIVRNKN